MPRGLILLLVLLLLACPNPAGGQVEDVLVPGERLKIGLVGGLVDGEATWFVRRVSSSGRLYLPDDFSPVVKGQTRGEVELRLRQHYGATSAVISRLDQGENHGIGQVAEPPPPLDPLLRGHRLNEPIVGEMTLRAAMDRIEAQIGLSIRVEFTAMELEGIDREAVYAFDLPAGISIGRAIEATLKDVSGGFASLGFAVREGIVIVTTMDEIARRMRTTEVYDIRDLLLRVDEPDRPQAVENLTYLITDLINPDHWRQNGGTAASISETRGYLVIDGLASTHAEVERLLSKLREVSGPGDEEAPS
jgi:hypothetical protein